MARPRTQCAADPDCTRQHYARGLCEPHYAAARRAGLLPDNQSRPPREATAAEVEWLLGTDAPETIAARLGYRNLEALCVALSRAGRVDLVARLRDDTDSGRVPRGRLTHQLT